MFKGARIRADYPTCRAKPPDQIQIMRTEQVTLHEWDGLYTFRLFPRSIRYSKRNAHHPYGVETAFEVTFLTPKGTKIRAFFRDIGSTQRAARSNALRNLNVYKRD